MACIEQGLLLIDEIMGLGSTTVEPNSHHYKALQPCSYIFVLSAVQTPNYGPGAFTRPILSVLLIQM